MASVDETLKALHAHFQANVLGEGLDEDLIGVPLDEVVYDFDESEGAADKHTKPPKGPIVLAYEEQGWALWTNAEADLAPEAAPVMSYDPGENAWEVAAATLSDFLEDVVADDGVIEDSDTRSALAAALQITPGHEEARSNRRDAANDRFASAIAEVFDL